MARKIMKTQIQAELVYITPDQPMENGCLVFDDKNTICEILYSPDLSLPTKHYNGILVAGLFNGHQHLELANIEIKQAKGLLDFIYKLKSRRGDEISQNDEMKKLDIKMYEEGVQFCADISNTKKSLLIKKNSKISYFNFIEIFGSDKLKSKQIIENAEQISATCDKLNLLHSIVPHATYSLNDIICNYLSSYNAINKTYTSIHFKESIKEDRIGLFSMEINKALKINDIENPYLQTPTNSVLDFIDAIFSQDQRILFVHNIYLTETEADYLAKTYKNCGFCLCPESNLFIEGKLMNENILKKLEGKIILGTDSKASASKMSMMNEMFLMQRNYHLSFHQILKMATTNPANFFQMEKEFGTLEKGKTPGLVLIKNINTNNPIIKEETVAERIL